MHSFRRNQILLGLGLALSGPVAPDSNGTDLSPRNQPAPVTPANTTENLMPASAAQATGPAAPANNDTPATRAIGGVPPAALAAIEVEVVVPPQLNIKEDGGRVWIEGVPQEHFDIHWDMHARAARSLMEYREVPLTLAQVLAYSGDAFNLCHASHFQGTAYLGAPHDPMRSLAHALGFEYSALSDGHSGAMRGKSKGKRPQHTQAALDQIAAEVKAGRPVLVGGTEDHCGTWTLAVGYDADTQQFCHVGTGGNPAETAYRWVKIRGVAPGSVDETFGVMDGRVRGMVHEGRLFGWHANAAYLFKRRIPDPPTPGERAIDTLQLAVRLHHAPSVSRRNWGGVDYHFGKHAYEAWADELEPLDFPGVLKGPYETNGVEPAYDWYEMGNMDMQIDQIVVGRSAAAAFCNEAAAALPQVEGPLGVAAQQYRAQVALAQEAFAAFIPRFNGKDRPRTDYLSNPDRCRAGAAAIRALLKHEQTAITAIEEALAALGKTS